MPLTPVRLTVPVHCPRYERFVLRAPTLENRSGPVAGGIQFVRSPGDDRQVARGAARRKVQIALPSELSEDLIRCSLDNSVARMSQTN